MEEIKEEQGRGKFSSGLGCGRDGGVVLALCSRMRAPVSQKVIGINWGQMVRNPLDVPHPLLQPLRRHRGLEVPGCGAAAPLSGSPYCPLLGILGLLLLNVALLGQDGYGGG